MIFAMPVGRPATAGPSGGASSRAIAAAVSVTVPRENGCDPVNISWTTTPKAKRSERVVAGAPNICSGAM
jgi:hypothetical protein